MVRFDRLTLISGWVLFLFGCFCLIDGSIALVRMAPCWIVRIAFGLVSLLFTSVVALLNRAAQLRVLAVISGSVVFIIGCLAMFFGIYARFTHFDDFKLWQWSMALGGIAVFISSIIAFLGAKAGEKPSG